MFNNRQQKVRRPLTRGPVLSRTDKHTVIAALGHSCLPFSFHQRFPPIRPMCHLSPFVLPPACHFHSPMCLSTTLSPLLRAGHKQVRQSADRVKTILSLFRFLHCVAPLTRETAYSKTIKSHFETMDSSRLRTDSSTDLHRRTL